jgi:hypothetical protein
MGIVDFATENKEQLSYQTTKANMETFGFEPEFILAKQVIPFLFKN